MKRLIFVFTALSFIFCGIAAAKDNNFGLGLIIGEPTGLSGKYWLDKSRAIDGALAWSGSKGDLHIHGDYLLHKFDLIKVEKGRLPLYFGIGGRLRLESNRTLGVRIPVGLDYIFSGYPLDIFIELAPVVDLIPDTSAGIDAAIGIRYFF